MATFTVDLLSGKIFLLNLDVSGGTSPTSGSTYPAVNYYSELPAPNTASGKIYVVRNGGGSYVVNRKPSGFYFSNGSTWKFLGDTPEFFNSNNFQIYDNADNTKGFGFVTSGITTGVFRKLRIQNSDGTIAYLTDLESKVDTSVFYGYTANTESILQNIINDIDYISGITSTLAGNKRLQLISTGNTDVNTITPTKIQWNYFDVYNTDVFQWTGNSKILIKESGNYEISYYAVLQNDSFNQTHIVAGIILLNNTTYLSKTLSNSLIIGSNGVGKMILSPIMLTLSNGDFLELVMYRVGNTGVVNLVSNSVYIRINKIS